MHTVGPYRLLTALSSCEVGGTWSGVDDAGRPVTIAVLNDRASADQRWRDAFAAAAATLAEAGADQLPIVASDHAGTHPWVACAVERGPGAAQIFAALGQRLIPVPQQTPQQQTPQQVPQQQARPVHDDATQTLPVTRPVSPVAAQPRASGSAAAASGAVAASGAAVGPVAGTAAGPASGSAAGPASGAAAAPASGAAAGPVSGAAAGRASGTAAGPVSGAAAGPVSGAAGGAAAGDGGYQGGGPWQTPPAQRAAPPRQQGPHQQQPPSRPHSGTPATAFPVERPDGFPPQHPGFPVQHPAAFPVEPPDAFPAQQRPDAFRTQHPDAFPAQQHPDGFPAQQHPDAFPPQQHPDAFPAQQHPDAYRPRQGNGAGSQQHPDGPSSGWPHPDAPTSVHPTSGHPTSGHPTSGHPTSGLPISGAPMSPYPGLHFPPQDPASAKPRRTGLVVALVALAALLVGAGGAAAVMAARPDPPQPVPTAEAPTTAGPTGPVDLALPAAPPKKPGKEPPKDGAWPADSPAFGATAPGKQMEKLDGVGFSFQVPVAWECTSTQRTNGAARYRCGVGTGDELVGGDLVVRSCEPCGESRRVELRRMEEAWGLQWTRSGPFAVFAETDKVDGEDRFGMVYVAYWRSQPDRGIDRQLVVRMSGPNAQADDIRRVVNSVRERTFTL